MTVLQYCVLQLKILDAGGMRPLQPLVFVTQENRKNRYPHFLQDLNHIQSRLGIGKTFFPELWLKRKPYPLISVCPITNRIIERV